MSVLRLIQSTTRVFLIGILALTVFIITARDCAFADNGEPVMVSFGDSYSSGEGNDPFYGQNSKDKYVDEDWLAHRSEASWPGRLQVNGTTMNEVKYSQNQSIITSGAKWFFYASSGAVAMNVYSTEPVSDSEVIMRNGKNKYKHAQSKAGNKHLVGERFSGYVEIQLEEARRDLETNGLSGDDVDYVTMSIGGNDIGFTNIVTGVALRNGFIDRDYLLNALNDAWYNYDMSAPVRYEQTANNWLNPALAEIHRKAENDESAKDQILKCYKSIRNEYPNAEIFIAGYPTLLDDAKFDEYLEHKQGTGFFDEVLSFFNLIDMGTDMSTFVGFADWEAWIINKNARDFNRELQSLVVGNTDASFHFVSVDKAFDGHEAEYLYGVSAPKAQDLTAFGVSAGSIHPNEKGLQIYADAVQKEITETTEELRRAEAEKGFTDRAEEERSFAADSSAERGIALVLDVSGSMAGDPMDATKNAASKFVNVALDNGAQTALVAYDDDAEVLSEFTTSEAYLKTAIGQLKDGGGTDMESGLASAKSLIAKEHAESQYIVLMSDGQPNDGKTGDDLISYAKTIRDPNHDGRDDVIIYALGFNEDASGQSLLRAIASDGCYISVHDAGDLEGFFQDMVDSINGVKFMYARVACPVDVSVAFGDETLDSAGDNPKTRTSFGSLTFEEDESGAGDDLVKVLRLREGQSYDVSIVGTGFGTMDYSIGFIDDEGIYSDFRTFSGIGITDRTMINTTAETAETTTLSIDEDGDGTVDKTYRAGANQEGELVDNSWVARAIVAGFAIIGLVLVGVLLWRVLKRRQTRADMRRVAR